MTDIQSGPSPSVSTVIDFALAIQRVSGGQFTGRFTIEGQRAFASFYGAPFFALSELAPETIKSPGSTLLFVTPDSSVAADGGRWLSLYAKACNLAHKLNLTVCIPGKPPSGKAPKPLLFQPPQQALVKDWRKHLQALDTPPDLVIFQPLNFDDLVSAADTFVRYSPGRKVLVSCATRLDALIAQEVLRNRGYAISPIVGFPLSEGVSQHHASGAWWLPVTVPMQTHPEPPTPDQDEPLKRGYQMFHGHLRLGQDTKEREHIAAMYATRTKEDVEGVHAVMAVRLLPTGGLCLRTGRFFSTRDDDAGGSFVWDEKVLSPDLLDNAPIEDATEDKDRLSLMLWLTKAMEEQARRDEADLREEEERVSEESDSGALAPVLQPDSNSETSSSEEMGSSAPIDRDSSPVAVESSLTPIRPRLSRNAGTVNVLAMAAMLGQAGATKSVPAFEAAKKHILDWLANKGFRSLDAASNHHVEHSDGEVTIETDGQSIWAMRFDDRRAMDDGAIWRVEVTLLGKGTHAISVRMAQVRSSEDAPPPVASGVPGVVAKIAQQIGLQDAGVPLVDIAQPLTGSKDAVWLGRLLLNPHRMQPVIAISGNIDKSADRLAKRLAGVAHVVRVDNAASESLIRTFGRDRSVYGNAVRLYRPGFTADTDTYQHPIWVLKGTALPKWLANDLFEHACAISLEVGDLEERAPSFQTIRNLLAEGRQAASEKRLAELRQQAESLATSAEEKITRLQAINLELEAALNEQKAQNRYLAEQATQTDSELQATRRERNAALEEVRQLKFQLSTQWNEVDTGYAETDDTIEYPDNWDDLETWVELYGQDRLVLHPKAAKAARESPFKDIPLAYKAFDYLVRYYIPMRTRSSDDNETYERSKQALAELGLEESDVGTADEIKRYKHEYKRLYNGKEVTLDRHLKRGVGFGGDFQFRLYFYYDDAEEKVLVGHLPTHLTNRLSHNG